SVARQRFLFVWVVFACAMVGGVLACAGLLGADDLRVASGSDAEAGGDTALDGIDIVDATDENIVVLPGDGGPFCPGQAGKVLFCSDFDESDATLPGPWLLATPESPPAVLHLDDATSTSLPRSARVGIDPTDAGGLTSSFLSWTND